MHSLARNRGPKGPLNNFDVGPRFGSTKLAAAAIRSALTLAVLSVLLLVAARTAAAQTETVLYNFNWGDGSTPQGALTSDGAGNFYGTTIEGGASGAGTVFELSPNGSGGWNETVLYSFTGGADGAYPKSNVIFDRAGNLYGTAWTAGVNGMGDVFELSPVGTSWTLTVLHSFDGADGALPASGLIFDQSGNLYGTTGFGGTGEGSGTVFEMSPSGGGWTEQVIYNLETQASTCSGVAMDASGNIFGLGSGGVFELSPNGNGGWNATVIHTFTGPPKDGQYWLACGTPVLDKAGNVYGTTGAGGVANYGTVYKLIPIKNGKNKGQWKERILHSFKGGKAGKDGNTPAAGVVLDAAGNIYGTTPVGGKFGVGTVFELELVAPGGTGSYQEKILWNFNGTDGNQPLGSLILDSAGNLYGTTAGGPNGDGNVFELTP